MPDILRSPFRMNCSGIDLVNPIDKMPPGSFPYLFNCRVLQEGRIEGRPGYTLASKIPAIPNSIRRLNDTLYSGAYSYFVGAGGNLYIGPFNGFYEIDTGYSANPLSLLTFRPNNSPDSWMYVYDQNKQNKFKANGTQRNVGVAPVQNPFTELGAPGLAQVTAAMIDTGWTANGIGSSPATGDRTATSVTAPTTGNVLYDSGTTGWACVQINYGDGGQDWAVALMQAVIGAGGGNAETAMVREIHNNYGNTTTTVQAVQYDNAPTNTGLCTLVLASNPSEIQRNSMLALGSGPIVVRVLAVTLAPDGITYSVRCSSGGSTITAGMSATGLNAWRMYLANTHAANETIGSGDVTLGGLTTAGVGGMGLATVVNAGVTAIGNRPISVEDYFHVSVFVANPANLVEIQIQIDIDPATTGLVNAFTGNYWTWTITPDQLQTSMNQWNELLLTINNGVQSGSSPDLTFVGVQAVQIVFTTTASIGTVATQGWYFYGTYGPTVVYNSPVGVIYEIVARDSSTGAQSVPSPPTRYELFPLNEEIVVTPQISGQPGVDSLDIYRQGTAGLETFTYVGTAVNQSGAVFDDVLSDGVVAGNPGEDLTQIQPWPILLPAISGLCNVVGTSVVIPGATGLFPLNLLAATVININGVAYETYGQPHSAFFLEIATSLQGGNGVNLPFTITNPVVYGASLPYVFGPLEGPFAPVAFGLGDPNNPGTLYYSNSSNLDSASDANTLEVAPPSEALISGEVWNGLVFIGSRDNIFLVRYSYLTTLGVQTGGPVVYQFNRIPAFSGMWSRWACCRGPDGVYFLGRDGIYKANESGAVNISDAKLYPIFPHDGEPAVSVNSGSNIILPVDMTNLTHLRLSCCDQSIYFDYIDTGANAVTLEYEITHQRWFLHNYAGAITYHYLVEASATDPNQMEIILLDGNAMQFYLSGGNDDDGAFINSIVLTPSLDQGDERGQKLYVDQMTKCDGEGTLDVAMAYNDAQVFGPVQGISVSGAIIEALQNIASLSNLALYRNIAAKYAWTGGPSGPRIYAFEPSGYSQPYVSQSIQTQYLNLSAPGWKHHRRLYGGLISNDNVSFTIACQDGRKFVYVIPSTGGQLKIVEMMLDQGIKDLAFAYGLLGPPSGFALFPEEWTVELKEWVQPDYIDLAVFKT